MNAMATKKRVTRRAPAKSRPDAWKEMAASMSQELRDAFARVRSLSDHEREILAQRIQEAIDNALEVPPDLRNQVEESAAGLMAMSGDEGPVAIAWRRTRERARRTAGIGAATTLPAMVPGLGSALAALGVVADWRFVAEQQRDLVLEIAAIFGVWPDDPAAETRTLFLAATATAFASPAAGQLVSKVIARQIARRSVARLVPGAGAAIAGALNYIATIAIGRAAIDQFARQAGIEVRGLNPEASHPAMPWLRNTVVDAFNAEAVLNGEQKALSDDAMRAIAELDPTEREQLLDLAAASCAAPHGPNERQERTLREVGRSLGFDDIAIMAASKAANSETQSYTEQITGMIGSVRDYGGRTAKILWERANRIAKSAAKRVTGRKKAAKKKAARKKTAARTSGAKSRKTTAAKPRKAARKTAATTRTPRKTAPRKRPRAD